MHQCAAVSMCEYMWGYKTVCNFCNLLAQKNQTPVFTSAWLDSQLNGQSFAKGTDAG